MTPKEPYLIRAFHQWILDNNCTPYVVVDAFQPNVMVPEQFIQPDGQITLNISPQATGNLCISDAAIEFSARFGGQPHHLYIPCYAVLAIFAKETNEGTGFAVVPAEQRVIMEGTAPKLKSVDSGNGPDDTPKPRKRAHLTIVK
jgi:stringent starvation protein B